MNFNSMWDVESAVNESAATSCPLKYLSKYSIFFQVLGIQQMSLMIQNPVQQLPAQTIKLITSTQIVTSVGTTVKELIENSIDAGAKVVQVRLENYGLDIIEVKDDGSGVSYDNVQKMFLPGFTSKIREYEDLDNLYSYGFRGEALAAICKIANVSITTKTNLDTLAMTYEIDSNGLPLFSKPSHLNNGTIITVSNLFSNLPVRRLFLSSKKKMSEELKKAEHVVQSLSLIHPELTVSLIHNKCPIWRKNSVKGVKQSFMQVAGLKTVSKMEYINKCFNQIHLDLIVPKKNLDSIDSVFSNSPHSVYVYVNKRPVNCKILSQPVQEHVFHHYRNLNITFKHAVCLVSVQISPQLMDINLEPNKTKILLKNHTQIIKLIDEGLKNYYVHEDFTCTSLTTESGEELVYEEAESEKQPSKRPRLSPPCPILDDKNKDWDLEIINDDCEVNSDLNTAKNITMVDSATTDQRSSHPQNLCSQINSNNCVLTTEEVSEINNKLSETNHKLLLSTNSNNSRTRLIERNDIQSRAVEKPILNDWPCRPTSVGSPQPCVSGFGEEINKVDNKAVEEIAEEIEKSVEEWSTEMLKAMKLQKNEGESSRNISEEDLNQFDLSVQSISSQMGKKEMKAFTKFARIMRPKISEEFPNINFTQIAGILVDRWKALTPDEVRYYEKMADVVEFTRKIHQEMKQNENLKPEEKPKKPPAPKTADLKAMFENLKKKNKISRPPRQEISLPISFNCIKNRQEKSDIELSDEDIHIIGKLHPSGNWLYIKGYEIGHVRHQGLQELIVFHKMLNGFSVPRKTLVKGILVNEENLGSVLWNVLISLEMEWDSSSSKYVITSDVIIKNGFYIEINKNEDVISSGNIAEVAEAIPQFGVSELKDALRLYKKNGEFGGLASWRPVSVYSYITNEAVRIAQQSTQPPDREQVEDMMNTYHLCFRHLPPVCLHSKEIFPSIFNLQNETPNIQEAK